jgi:hypothetical protein
MDFLGSIKQSKTDLKKNPILFFISIPLKIVDIVIEILISCFLYTLIYLYSRFR